MVFDRALCRKATFLGTSLHAGAPAFENSATVVVWLPSREPLAFVAGCGRLFGLGGPPDSRSLRRRNVGLLWRFGFPRL
jgi:hypothetical protein